MTSLVFHCLQGEYHKTQRELDTVKGRFRAILVSEAELRSARSMEQDMPRKLQEAVLSQRNTENELRQTKQQRALAVQEAKRYQQLLDDRASNAAHLNTSQSQRSQRDVKALVAQNDTLVSLVAKYKGKAEQLHVLKENSGLKVRNYEVQLEEVQERNTALAKENVALNEGLHQQRRETHKAQDEARAVQNRWEGGATKKERQALEDALAQREALYSGLAREAEQARVHCDVANEQVAALTSLKASETSEGKGATGTCGNR
jgi:chromosome segregation ATPase